MQGALSLPDSPPEDVRITIPVMTPVSGKSDVLTSHDDALVSQGIMGPGLMIHTASHLIHSPVSGKITACDPLSYTYEITSKKGLKLRVSYGHDMTRFMGEKCEFLRRKNDDVKSGEPVIRLNPAWLRQQQVPSVCVVNVVNVSKLKELVPAQARHLSAPHDVLFTVYA